MIINNLRLSLKNKKLKKNAEDTERFIIWSIPAVTTCPNATQGCIKFCYALQAEKQYKRTRDARLNNYIESLQTEKFIRNMVDAIDQIKRY